MARLSHARSRTMIRATPVSVFFLLLATAACGGDDPDADRPPTQDTVLTRGDTSQRPVGEPADTGQDVAPGQEPTDPAREPGDPAQEPEPPADTGTPRPGGATGTVGVNEWTVGIVEGGPETGAGSTLPTVTGVRTARHPDFDRFVLEFSEAGGLPPFHVEYVDRPVRECGSGHVVELPGDGWLEIRMSGAQAHDEEGRVTVEPREGSPGLPVLLAYDLTCDFEAHVEWVLAVRSPNPFRVLDLREPYRLVVDVRH